MVLPVGGRYHECIGRGLEAVRHFRRLIVRRHLATALLAAIACGGVPGEAVPLLDYQVVVPPAFQARQPSSSMRLAEFTVPESGAPPAEVVVYYFGEGQGGSVEANIARWSAQFTGPDGSPVAPRLATAEGTAFPTTVASTRVPMHAASGSDAPRPRPTRRSWPRSSRRPAEWSSRSGRGPRASGGWTEVSPPSPQREFGRVTHTQRSTALASPVGRKWRVRFVAVSLAAR